MNAAENDDHPFAPNEAEKRGRARFCGLTREDAEQRYAHGTRARYKLADCRCFPCRVAKANYDTELQAERRQPYSARCVAGGRGWQVRHTKTNTLILHTSERSIAKRQRDILNRRADRPEPERELISTHAVLAHISALRTAGVGLRAIAAAADVSRSLLRSIALGSVTRTRRATADRILSVGTHDAHPSAYVDSTETWEIIDRLLAKGYSRLALARQLAISRQTLIYRRPRIRAGTACAARRLIAPYC